MPYVALVLTAPQLTGAHIAAVQAVSPLLKALSPVTLSPAAACEWALDIPAHQASDLLDTARAALADTPVDVNIVSNDENRRKRLLIADMDSTIIEQECIDEIADFAGCGAEVSAITERAMRGELDFEEALTVRVGLLKGLDTATLQRVVTERLTITPGAETLVATMAANGAYCALVSGGFTFFTSRIAHRVGFHENRANSLEVEGDKLTGRPIPPILGRQAKLDALHEISMSRNLLLDATLAVGDGANDLAMIKAAGLGVAYHAKPVVAAEAKAAVNHSDLTALLYLQGYHRTDFV
ncbi:MAG: phosphoserine phosphatase SerB [Hyphomicrobiaceae bacterium]